MSPLRFVLSASRLVIIALYLALAPLLKPLCSTYALVAPPDSGCYLAAFIPNGLTEYTNAAGKGLAIEMFYCSWSGSANFPQTTCDNIIAKNLFPHLTWEPWNGSINDATYSLQSIISGTHDAYIRRWAQQIRDWKKELFIRFAHEMNGNWYPWDGTHNGGATTTGYGSAQLADGPERYVDAWRHIRRIFDSTGARNVTWIWAPNVTWAPSDPLNRVRGFYPGDAYVDWLGIDGYNWGTVQTTSTWSSFAKVFKATYDSCLALSPTKPIMIAEFACTEMGGDKAAWITDAFRVIKTDFPQIKAITWFDVNKETDWRINSSTAAQSAYRQAVADPYYLTKVQMVGIRPEMYRSAGTPLQVRIAGNRLDFGPGVRHWSLYSLCGTRVFGSTSSRIVFIRELPPGIYTLELIGNSISRMPMVIGQ